MVLSIAASDIAWRSHWLRQAIALDDDLQPGLEGRIDADVCIVGGGYLGLWTAIKLREQSPDLDVVILERDICGGGPSGRNSGMVLSAWPKFPALAAIAGEVEALRLVRASAAAIDEIEQFCGDNGIDAWFDRVRLDMGRDLPSSKGRLGQQPGAAGAAWRNASESGEP